MTNQLIIKMVLDSWNATIKQADNLFDKLSDEQMQHEISPGRNSGTYLLGHLTAVHDRMIPLLNLGEQLFPKLDDIFINHPDKTKTEIISTRELRLYWKKVNSTLAHQFNTLKAEEWFQRHNSVSNADFEKEPHRNKLNVMISRTNHLSYHLGQLTLLNN